MTAHLLAKLAPHGTAITGAGFGGKSELSALDVAGALGMPVDGKRLSHPAYLFGLLKYAGDHQVLGRLDRIMRGHVSARAKALSWQLTDEQIAGLARVAIFENLYATVCLQCNGSGLVAGRECADCLGSGRVPMSQRARAAVAGTSKSSWNRNLDKYSRQLWAIVAEWESELVWHLRGHFRRE